MSPPPDARTEPVEIARAGDRRVVDAAGRERFEIHAGGVRAGTMMYVRRPRLIALTHTRIDPAHEGRGVGGDLVAAVLDHMRGGGVAVLPFCPFVNAHIARNREYVDLVPEALRPDFGL